MTDAPPAGGAKRQGKLKEVTEPRGSPINRYEDQCIAPVLPDLLSLLNDIFDDTKDLKRIDERTIRARVYYRCKVSSYERPLQMMKHYSKALLEHLGPQWRPTAFYSWLKIVSKQKPDDLDQKIIDGFPKNLRRRNVKDKVPTAAAASFDAVSQAPSPRTQTEPDSGSESEVRQGKRPRIGRTSGKKSALRPRKRLASEMDEEESPSSSRRGRKPAKRVHTEDDETGDSDLAGSGEEEAEELSTPDDRGPVQLVLHAENIPSMSPSGPNGTWTCDQEDCNYIVRSADDEEGKQLIEAHFKEHERQMRRLNLAVEEGNRGRNPIE